MRALGYSFALIGVALLSSASLVCYGAVKFRERAITVDGEVAELVKTRANSNSGSQYLYIPVVAFRSTDGVRHKIQGSVASYPPAHAVGENVKVHYDPNDTSNITVGSSMGDKLFPAIVLSILGLVFGAIGGVAIYLESRGRNTRSWMTLSRTVAID